ncbi:MAG: hypothetical protein AB8B84_10170 [Granulosicoccus sp.]
MKYGRRIKPLLAATFISGILTMNSASASPLGTVSPDPQVVGNTITVANDGWYQFQEAHTFNELCAGTFKCTVPNGRYIVVNHSNGQRWESVDVNSASSSFLTINGSTLSFPDDGWYQVQDSTTYTSVCNGLNRCSVADGTYNVINHTSGERWNAVVISTTSGTANELLFANDGWYQVQTASTFESVCEGVLRCEVQDGTYIVINHTTGQRYEDVRLSSGETETPTTPALTFTSANATRFVQHIVSVINEDEIDRFFENAQNDLNFRGRLFFLSNTVDDIQFSQGITLDSPYQLETVFDSGEFTDVPVRSEYTCASGGSIYRYSSDRVFNDCTAGNNTYNGLTGRRLDGFRGTLRNYPFRNFSATDSSGSVSELTGGYITGNTSFVILKQTQKLTNAKFSTSLSDGPLNITNLNIERLDYSNLGFTSGNITVSTVTGSPVEIINNSQRSSINGTFTVTAGWTQQEAVDVTVSLSFEDTIRQLVDDTIVDFPGSLDPRDPFEWQAGSIVVSTQGGDSMTIVPTTPANQTFSILLSNGETVGPLSWSDGYTIDCGSPEICGD